MRIRKKNKEKAAPAIATRAAADGTVDAGRTPAVERRCELLDRLKTIGIFLVLIYHARPPILLQDPLESWRYVDLFAHTFSVLGVPLFFFSNGALLLNRPFDARKHYPRMIRMVVLGVTWASLSMLFLKYHRGVYYDTRSTIRAILAFEGNWLTHFWFIKALVAVHIIAPLLKLAFDNSKTIFQHCFFLSILFTFGVNFANKLAVLFSWDWEFLRKVLADYNVFAYHYSFALAYFMAGGLFLHHYNKAGNAKANAGEKDIQSLSRTQSRLLPSCAAGVLLFAIAATMLWGVFLSRKSGVFDAVFPEYSSILAFVATLSLAYLVSRVKDNFLGTGGIVRLIGKNSLGIYFLHIPILDPLRLLFRHFSIAPGMFSNFILAVLLLFSSLLMTLLLKKIPVVRELFRI
ncbi:MAG: acyltransferase [Puniceicoccales bacterium]|jgi:surface polysaccharide O-acyltransferase-like enzyme|nr:acyltransferase [Puniceicoccales bacterium]